MATGQARLLLIHFEVRTRAGLYPVRVERHERIEIPPAYCLLLTSRMSVGRTQDGDHVNQSETLVGLRQARSVCMTQTRTAHLFHQSTICNPLDQVNSGRSLAQASCSLQQSTTVQHVMTNDAKPICADLQNEACQIRECTHSLLLHRSWRVAARHCMKSWSLYCICTCQWDTLHCAVIRDMHDALQSDCSQLHHILM
jgi:hypothetical protein